MNYYKVNVKLIGSKLDYLVPDVKKISGAKYKWTPANKGVPNSLQAQCCFVYPDVVPDTADLASINQTQYDDFAKVIVTADKAQIQAGGTDGAVITVKFPEGGGKASFVITKPNQDRQTVERQIPANGIVTLPKENLTTKEKGMTKISIRSDEWHDVSGLGEISIEST